MTGSPSLDCFVQHYGFTVSLVDSDETDFIAMGHHGWRVIAAFNRLARQECGLVNVADDKAGIYDPTGQPLRQTYAVETTGNPLDWHLEWDVPEETPGAFPVTVWQG